MQGQVRVIAYEACPEWGETH